MELPSLAEIVRRMEDADRRIASKLSRELYDRDHKEIKEDISEIRASVKEIKDSFSWGIRLFVAQFLALIVGLLFFLLGQP
jgi:uncharacterized membrane protein YgaE (UPF0421/DUF939 family)